MTRGPVRAGELVGQRLGKFEILALIAVGGTAEIYLARIDGEAGFEKYLVVKCLLDHLADNQEFVRMFLDEARLGAQLDHSNIVQTLELGQHDERYYMVMEYLAGMSLAQLARKTQERVPGGLMPVDLVLGLAAQACAGLSYAHGKSIDGKDLNLVHRDVSPQNLVVTFEGVLKIVDFGIAKSDVRQSHTRTGTIKGKFAYMSPEQCLSQPIDQRTDIFALGTICHELLTGRRLFKRQSTYDTYQAIVNGRVPPPSQINPKLDKRLDDLIMKALEYDKEKRYANAEAFGEALLSTLHQRGTAVGAGDVARYIEEHFGAELDEHGERMRQLISGARAGDGRPNTWDEELLDDEGSAGAGESVSFSAVEEPAPPPIGQERQTRVHEVDDDDEDDEEGPTRVEFDSAGRVAELHRTSAGDIFRQPTVSAEGGDTGELSLSETPAPERDAAATGPIPAVRPRGAAPALTKAPKGTPVARSKASGSSPPSGAARRSKPGTHRSPTEPSERRRAIAERGERAVTQPSERRQAIESAAERAVTEPSERRQALESGERRKVTETTAQRPAAPAAGPALDELLGRAPLPRAPSDGDGSSSAAAPDDYASPPDTLEPAEPGEFPAPQTIDEPLLGASLPVDDYGDWTGSRRSKTPPPDYPRSGYAARNPWPGPAAAPAASSDARPASWLVAAVFVACAGIGLGATLLVARLFG